MTSLMDNVDADKPHTKQCSDVDNSYDTTVDGSCVAAMTSLVDAGGVAAADILCDTSLTNTGGNVTMETSQEEIGEEEINHEDIVFLITKDEPREFFLPVDGDGGNDARPQFEVSTLTSEENQISDHEIAAITVQEHEMTLSLQQDMVVESESDEDILPTELCHLTKREFTKRIEHQFPTELSVLKLRDKLASDIRAADTSALTGQLLTRSATKRSSGVAQYIADCYVLQRYIDGDTMVDIDSIAAKPKTSATPGRTKIVGAPSPGGTKTTKATEMSRRKTKAHDKTAKNRTAPAKRLTAKSKPLLKVVTRNGAVTKKRPFAPIDKNMLRAIKKQVRKDKVKSQKKNESEDGEEMTSKLNGTIKGLRAELKQLRAAMKDMQKSKLIKQEIKSEPEDEDDDEEDEDDEGDEGDDEADEDNTSFQDENEAESLTYYISEEQFTNRGGRKLIASDGNVFTIKRSIEKKGEWTIWWRCHRRFRNSICTAMVVQRNDTFTAGVKGHKHDEFPDFERFSQGIPKADLVASGDSPDPFTLDMGGGFMKTLQYECSECEMRFLYRRHLEQHGTQVHGAAYLCKICVKGFKDHMSYKEHMLCVHTSEKTFSCDHCGKMFYLKKLLMKHAKTHGPKIRSYICDDCGKGYTSADILSKHMQSHAVPSHLCTHCGKLFKTKGHLQGHINIHTRERLYQCSWCGKNYTHMSHMQVHARRHHTGEKPYACDFCDKRFVAMCEKKEHECIHTGKPRRSAKKVGPRPVQAKRGNKVIHTGASTKRHKKRDDVEKIVLKKEQSDYDMLEDSNE